MLAKLVHSSVWWGTSNEPNKFALAGTEAQNFQLKCSLPPSLRWNDFEANVSRSFAGIRDHSQFFDCTLTTDDDEAYSDNLRAHKVILSACSEFFRNILTKESMSAHPNPLIYLR